MPRPSITIVPTELLNLISITAITQGSEGSVQISKDGRLLYEPKSSGRVADTFTVTLKDLDGVTITKKVSILAGESEDSETDEALAGASVAEEFRDSGHGQ